MRNPFRKQPQKEAAQPASGGSVEAPPSPAAVAAQILPLDFAPNDPLSAYLLNAGGPVDLERLKLESPALDSLREAGVKLIAPLAGQGELIGLLNLGPRRSEQEYTADDRKLSRRPGDPGRTGRARGAARPPAADRGAGP